MFPVMDGLSRAVFKSVQVHFHCEMNEIIRYIHIHTLVLWVLSLCGCIEPHQLLQLPGFRPLVADVYGAG